MTGDGAVKSSTVGKKGRLTQAEIAAHMGCSQPWVSQMKRRGAAVGDPMPVDSLAAVEVWWPRHCSEGCGHKSKGRPAAPVARAKRQLRDNPPPVVDAGDVEGDDLEAMGARLARTERLAWEALEAALRDVGDDELDLGERASAAGRLGPLQREHGRAVGERVRLAAQLLDVRERAGRLVPVELAKRLIEERLSPVDRALRGLAKNRAAAANPEDPAVAEAAIAAGVAEIFKLLAPGQGGPAKVNPEMETASDE